MADVDGSGTPEVSPQPGPFTVNVDVLPSSVGLLVMLELKTHGGSGVIFTTPEQMLEIGQMIVAKATTAASGILLPPGTIMPAPEQPEQN